MKQLIERHQISENVKAFNRYQQLGKLLTEVEKKELLSETIDLINKEIEQLNSIPVVDTHFVKAIKVKENSILKLLEKTHKIVPKNYYRKLWMVVGMSAFGLPIGVAFGLSMENIALLGIGLPIGMAIGIVVGSTMDKKALHEGRQLDFEVKL